MHGKINVGGNNLFSSFTLFTAPPMIVGGSEGRPRYVIFQNATDQRNVTLNCDIQPSTDSLAMGRYNRESWQRVFNGSFLVAPNFTYSYTFTMTPSDNNSILYQCRVEISHAGTASTQPSEEFYTGGIRIVSKGL